MEKFVKICPKCGSTNWKMAGIKDFEGSFAFAGQASMHAEMKCLDCGYVGNFLEADENELKEIQKEIKNSKNNNNNIVGIFSHN